MAYLTYQNRRDTAANWTTANPTLVAGEIGYETDSKKLKIGDGVTAWASLAYFTGGGAINLDDLGDVIITAPASNASLVYNGANWIDSVLTYGLNDLTDVTLTTPVNGNYLMHTGVEWVNTALSLALDNLSDVVITTPATGAVLQYDGADWIDGLVGSSNITALAITASKVRGPWITNLFPDFNMWDSDYYESLDGGTITFTQISAATLGTRRLNLAATGLGTTTANTDWFTVMPSTAYVVSANASISNETAIDITTSVYFEEGSVDSSGVVTAGTQTLVASGTTTNTTVSTVRLSTGASSRVGRFIMKRVDAIGTSVLSGRYAALRIMPALNVPPIAGDPSTLANGDVWYNSTTGKFMAREAGTSYEIGMGRPLDVGIFVQGLPTAAELVLRLEMPRACSFPTSLTGSHASAAVASTGTKVFDLLKNGVSFGSVTFTTSATGTFTSASGATFAAGDVLTITAPAVVDATLADISITLVGTRT